MMARANTGTKHDTDAVNLDSPVTIIPHRKNIYF
jgi:hypothetical protein